MGLDFQLTDDQQVVFDAFGAFFEKECPIDVVRGAEPLGFSQELWEKLQGLDAPGMAVAEEHGGGGASLSDLIVVAEWVGRSLAPAPLIDHWAASAIVQSPDVISGESIASLAVRPAVDGVWQLVPAGAVADVVVGVDGDELVAVRSEAPREPIANHASAPLATRSARDGDRVVLGDADQFAAVLDEWRVLTASALVGIADAALKIGVQYVLDRQQFGRPIGAFQAIQHTLADLPALIDGAKFLAHKAAWAYARELAGEPGEVDMVDGRVTRFAPLASMAFIAAGDAAAHVADRSLHYHGGYGFSLEYDIQLYFRRALGWARILGSPGEERRRLADLLWPRRNDGGQ